jgi:uncharacterized protein
MHLTLHITTDCNMNCSYCYSPPKRGEAMKEQTGFRALDLGSRITDGSCGIVFFGGEPLLHKDFINNIMDYGRYLETKQLGQFHFKVTTNGALLDEDFIEYSITHDLLIAMSFDGIREAHDTHRLFPGGKPSFDVLLPKLKLLLEMRPYSSILTVVNPGTVSYFSKSIEFLASLNCRYLIVSLNYAAPWEESHLGILKKELEKLAGLYMDWTLQERKFYFSPFEVKLSSHINRHCFKKERCELGRRQISVDPQGFLYPCVQFTRAGPESEWCIGNIFEGIDERKRQRIYQQSEKEKKVCMQCAIKDRCNNSCGCLNWQTTGSINKISPVLCRYEQMLVPIADKIGRTLYKKRDSLFLHKHYNASYPVLSLLEDAFSKK